MYDLTHATPDLFAALAKAHGEIENASKNAANPHFRSKYADLAECLNTARPVLSAHGLTITQFPAFDGAMVHVTSTLAHSGGGYITSTVSCVPAKTDAQGVGAAITYLRRYGYAAIAGIAQEDDDGNAAAHDGKPAAVRQPSREETARAKDFADAIKDAQDDAALAGIAKELATSGLPPDLLAKLRATYNARRAEIAKAAA